MPKECTGRAAGHHGSALRGMPLTACVNSLVGYVDVMHVVAEDLMKALRAEGLRMTPARKAVCAVLAMSHGEHLSAADIHDRTTRDAGVGLDQSTVYRTLDTLEAAGLITHTHLGHGALVYHLTDEAPHQHLVCATCGATTTLPERQLEGLLSQILEQTGFVADPTHVALTGRCRECAAASQPSH
jgi:Fur family ferric uptake transcriptional regulator